MKKISIICSSLILASTAFAQVPDNAVKYDKMVVVEEGTGTWCQWCPRGTATLEYFLHNAEYKDRFIGIAVHYQFKGGPDPMATVEMSDYSTALNIPAFPGGRVNRSADGKDIDFSQPDMVTPFFEGDCYTNAKITSLDYDKQNSTIAVNAEFKVGYDCQKAYNATVVCMENNVSGLNSGYSQHNAYYTWTADDITRTFGEDWLPYFKNYLKGAASNIISYKKMVYNHVARCSTNFNGEEIAAEWKADEPVAKTITVDMPGNVLNVEELDFVVLMLDPANGEIVGAHKAALFPKEEPVTPGGDDPVTPGGDDPDVSVGSVEAASVVSSAYFDLQGRRVVNPANGLYLRRDTHADGRTSTVKVAL